VPSGPVQTGPIGGPSSSYRGPIFRPVPSSRPPDFFYPPRQFLRSDYIPPNALYGTTPPPAPRPPALLGHTGESENYVPVPDTARVLVDVPANSKLWFNGYRMRQTGAFRKFVTPTLKPDHVYTYEVRARWKRKGRYVTQTQTIDVSAGDHLRVAFPVSSGSKKKSGAKSSH
jgi:uncharacterized protein (TIGR03000 family)